MVTVILPMTAEDLLRMEDDGFRYELVRGELRKMSPAGHVHGDCAMSVGSSLRVYVAANGLGKVYAAETGFMLASDHVRAPDAAFVRRERALAVGRNPGFFPGPPDLAVEVVSPNDRDADVEEKVADWLAAGTLAVIVVDPGSRIVRIHRPDFEVETLTEADTIEVADVIGGWEMPVLEIFED